LKWNGGCSKEGGWKQETKKEKTIWEKKRGPAQDIDAHKKKMRKEGRIDRGGGRRGDRKTRVAVLERCRGTETVRKSRSKKGQGSLWEANPKIVRIKK